MTEAQTSITTINNIHSDCNNKDNNCLDNNNGGECPDNKEPLLEMCEDEITGEDLAPDGGFAWFIAFSMTLVIVATTGPGSSFAIVFGKFFEESGQSGAIMTLLNSVFMITFSLSGLLTTALLKKYPMRQVGVIASVIYVVPNFWLAFITQVWHLVVIFFIQGVGFGLMNNICNANFNAYWVKKRTKVMSGAHVIVGLGGIVYPIMIEKFMSHYGFRGTAILMAALSLNCIMGMMLMHPVEWHTRDPEEVRKERSRLVEEGRILRSDWQQEKPFAGKFVHHPAAGRRSTIHVAQVFAKPSRWSSLRSLKEGGGGPREVPLLIETLRVRVASDASDVVSSARLRSGSTSHRAHNGNSMSGLSATSIGNIAGVGSTFAEVPSRIADKRRRNTVDSIKNNGKETDGGEVGEVDFKSSGFFSNISDLFELSLFKDRTFMSMSLGISLVFMSDFTFSSLLPLMMGDAGYTSRDAALAITVAATAELVSRIFLAVFTLFVNARPKFLFFLAMIFMGFAKIGFFYWEDTFSGILVSVAIIGVVRSWLFVPQPLVVVENFPVEKYAGAYGIFSLVSGVVTIFFGPVVGFVKDWTNSFATCQLVLIVLNSIFIVPWALEFLAERNRKDDKKKTRGRGTNAQDKIESLPSE